MANIDKIINGNDLMLFVYSGSTVQPIALSKSASLTLTNENIDVKSKDSAGWPERLYGDFDWSVSADGLVAFSATGTTQCFYDLNALYLAKVPLNFKLGIKSGTSPSWTVDAAKKSYSGKVTIGELSLTADMGAISTYSVKLNGASELKFS